MRDFTGAPGAAGGTADDDTRWTPAVGNSIVQEIANVITSADGGDAALDPGDNTQLLTAIATMIEASAGALYTEGVYETTISLGAVRIKVGVVNGSFGETVLSHYFETPFPTVCWGVFPVIRNTTLNLSRDAYAQGGYYDASGFTVPLNWSGGSGTSANNGIQYLAFGR